MRLKEMVKWMLWLVAGCWAAEGHSQDLYWTLQGKGPNVRINDVAVDGQGNAYVTGSYEGQMEFDGAAFTSVGGEIYFGKNIAQWADAVGNYPRWGGQF